MTTIGRNDPCTCGSGKKYKKCCLPAHQARQAELRKPSPAVAEQVLFDDDDGLDDLSNSVIDLVAAERFDDALAACKRLLEGFPDVVDGLERSGMVHEKMGNHAIAADFYRKALDFITHPSRRDDYEDSDFYRTQIERLERLAALR